MLLQFAFTADFCIGDIDLYFNETSRDSSWSQKELLLALHVFSVVKLYM